MYLSSVYRQNIMRILLVLNPNIYSVNCEFTNTLSNKHIFLLGIKYLDNVKLVESFAVKEETAPSIGQEMLPSSERVQKPDLDHCEAEQLREGTNFFTNGFRTAENLPLIKSEPEPSEIPR